MGAVAFGRRKIYRRTFYPDATEVAQARIVEVKPGDEATDIDITLGRAVKTYRASGRFVNDETGQPAPNVTIGYGTLDPSGRRVASYGFGMATNGRGEFQTEGLSPGRYAVFALPPQDASDFYSDAVNFEITDADVSGIVVKMKRGASVSGSVTIEGVSDRANAARLLSQVRVYGFVQASAQAAVPNYSRPQTLAPDGSFRFGGLRPGKLNVSASAEGTKALMLSRIELNGVPVRGGGIEVAEGAQVAGVRVVMVYGSAVIRGQVNFINGALPPNARVIAFAQRLGAGGEGGFGEGMGMRQVAPDVRGLFVFEGLAAGDYEVIVRVFNIGRASQSEAQRVSVAEGGETSVTSVIDLSAPPKGGRR
jgi:hypothetical protein